MSIYSQSLIHCAVIRLDIGLVPDWVNIFELNFMIILQFLFKATMKNKHVKFLAVSCTIYCCFPFRMS